MGTKRLKVSSDYQNWNRIFNAMVHMLQGQQIQLESAAKERKIIEDRFKMLYDRWRFDVRVLEEQIAQVKGDLLVRDMEASLEAAKSDLVFGLKQREAYLGQLKLEYSTTEKEEFKELLKLLAERSIDPKGCRDSNAGTKNSKADSEIKRLKQENEKLAAEKNSEVSALLAEKKFVWNQFKILENDCANKLESKSAEVQQAEEKVWSLIASLEQLQSSDREKDGTISQLTSQMTKTKEESEKLKQEIRRLREELDLLRKSRSDSVTPALKHCTNRTKSSNLQGNQSDKKTGTSSTLLRKPPSGARAGAPKSIEGSKRKREDPRSTPLSPKLFTSNFKVPKLKNSPSVVRL